MTSLPDVPCGVLVFDDDLRVLDANPRAVELLGRPLAELRDRPLPDLLSRGGRIFFHTHVLPSLALKGRVDEVYLHLRTGAGEDVPVVLSGERDPAAPDRSVASFLPMHRRQLFEHELVAARDAAEEAAQLERQAKEQIRHAQAQLALRERLASLGTLAHGIAHEINNPLTYVAANLELIADALRGPGPIDRAELLELAQDASQGTDRIREITRQMGSLVRADEQARAPLDPKGVASLVVRMTTVHTRARAAVELVLDDVPLVDADSGRLGQVLINLVINAVHAFGERPAAENRVRVVTRTSPEGWALIEVEDNGPGIAPAVAPRVFEPFFTTKPVGEGSGLGLSISRGLAESLGGSLTFETDPGRGTTFRVALPPSRGERAPPAATPLRVLVVDDEPAVARALARLLRRYDVTTALSAEEALERIRTGPRFDFVFSDLHMPRQDGLALREAIAATDPPLSRRMAFVTGAVSDEACRRLTDLGLRIFRKPVDVPALLAFCDEHLRAEPR